MVGRRPEQAGCNEPCESPMGGGRVGLLEVILGSRNGLFLPKAFRTRSKTRVPTSIF